MSPYIFPIILALCAVAFFVAMGFYELRRADRIREERESLAAMSEPDWRFDERSIKHTFSGSLMAPELCDSMTICADEDGVWAEYGLNHATTKD